MLLVAHYNPCVFSHYDPWLNIPIFFIFALSLSHYLKIFTCVKTKEIILILYSRPIIKKLLCMTIIRFLWITKSVIKDITHSITMMSPIFAAMGISGINQKTRSGRGSLNSLCVKNDTQSKIKQIDIELVKNSLTVHLRIIFIYPLLFQLYTNLLFNQIVDIC